MNTNLSSQWYVSNIKLSKISRNETVFLLEFCISIALEANSHKKQSWFCEMKTSRHRLCWLCTSAFFKPWMDMTLVADSSALGLGPSHYKLHSREGLRNTAYFNDKCFKTSHLNHQTFRSYCCLLKKFHHT